MQIKSRQQLLTVLALVALALLALDRLVLPPLSSFYKGRAARITDLRSKLKEGTQLLRRQELVRSRWVQMETNTLPNNTSAAEQQVLKAFDQWAQQSGVSINSLMPQWKQDADDYKTLECRVDAAGDLGTLTRFLYDIERDPMALKLQSLDLAARDTEGRQLSLSLQVSGLVLTPPQRP